MASSKRDKSIVVGSDSEKPERKVSKRDKNHPEASYSLGRMGWSVRSAPTLPPNKRGGEEIVEGKPDIYAIGNNSRTNLGQGRYIEVKFGYNNSLSLGDWRMEQRDWPLQWGHPDVYYLWVSSGDDMPHLMDKPFPRRTWLVPYYEALATVKLIEPYQSTIPYLPFVNSKTAIKERNLCMVEIWHPYELEWKGSKEKWYIPLSHPFWKPIVPRLQWRVAA